MMPSPPLLVDGQRLPAMAMPLPTSDPQTELAAFAAEMISFTWFGPSSPSAYPASLSPVSLASPTTSPFDPAIFVQVAAGQQRLATGPPAALSPLSMPTLYSPAPPAPTTTASAAPPGHPPHHSSAYQPQPPSPRELLKHILPSPQFVKFIAYVLQTTQVGQSAVLLGILYLERYRRVCVASAKAAGGRHRGGNEYRLFVTSLLLANKCVDDNNYTNSTWAAISGLPLSDINSMERQFLAGIGFHLHVTPDEYRAWIARLWELSHSRRETIRSFAAFRAAQQAQQQQHQQVAAMASRPMSDGSQSSRPPTFAFGGHPHQLAQPYPYAPPLFGAPQPIEGFQLHPSYLPPPPPSQSAFVAGRGLQPPPMASTSQLPSFGVSHPTGTGQVTPRASFDGSGSVPTVNVNPAISTPASHRTVDGLAAGSHPSATSSSRKQASKRRAADAFSPSNSPMPASQQLDNESRPAKRLQAGPGGEFRQQRPNTGSTIAPLANLTMPWSGPSGVVTSLPSLKPGGSPMEILGQPWVFEGHDAMGAKQLFVCSLMADGPRRYQLIQQQRPTFQQPSAAAGYAQAPYLIPMQTLPTYRYPTASASSSLAGHAQQQQQHMFATSPSAMLLPPTAHLQQHPIYHQPQASQSTDLFLPPAAYHPHQPQQQPSRAYQQLQPQQQPFQPMNLFAYAHALPPTQPPNAAPPSLGLPTQPAPVKLSPITFRPPSAPEVDPETAKRNRVERWRREVSSSSGG